jgi:hypothetical protein
MRKLTATICLTIAVLLGSVGDPHFQKQERMKDTTYKVDRIFSCKT